MIVKELKLPISSTTYWTDSTAVLQYIQSESRRFKTFVANRIAKIHDESDPSQWRHVDSKSNPADDGSRCLKADEMIAEYRWIKGPDFLLKDAKYWPVAPVALRETIQDDIEVKKEVKVNCIVSDCNINKLLQRYSSWYKLKVGVAWLRRFIQYLCNKGGDNEERKRSSLTLDELRQAENVIIKLVQRQEFNDVLEGRAVRRSMRKLNPLVRDGILRVGGRLSNSPLDFEMKHPIILPSKNPVTDLLIRHHHQIVGHSGAGMTWSSLRQKYWVIKGGVTVRRVIGNCFDCRRRNAPPVQQFMGELPAARVTPAQPPFTDVGLDYFGPILTKQGRKHLKRYGCIFTCLATRAVHIEIAQSLDTDSFLNAFRRFIGRRGLPKNMYSDNGTNFKGGEAELREGIKAMNQSKLNLFFNQKEVGWHFNPPMGSHMGGVWERLIRSVRKILRAHLKEQIVTDEVLSTVMVEIEAILNSRPLTDVSLDAKDMQPLTPNHLLLLKQNPNYPPGLFTKEDMYTRKRWRQVQYLADQFWKRWIKEYLPLLQVRQKWMVPKPNLSVDDIVLVVDGNCPRGKWPLGRVVRVYPDKVGHVRQVEVRVGAKYLRRPVVKLCLLEQSEKQKVNGEV